ncbi:hypothetical protein DRO34_01665 [Candidatus Bathyarchaeota archaeon]|nr:MAG: hypothetical protein DRO34_01665 [Candidatus Bathyarchaeota archaeon]
MSSEKTPGLVLAGKFFGFLLLIVGLVLIYDTWAGINPLGVSFSALFIFWGLILAVAGFLIIFARIEE